MAVTLAAILTRTEDFLLDGSNSKFTEADITNAIRAAMGEVSLKAGEVLTLDGLDSAAATTLPARLESVLVVGAAAHCALMRAGARADWESQAEGEPKKLFDWGSYWMKYFLGRVSDFYPTELRMYDQRRSAAPFASWADDLGEKDSK